MSIFRSYFSKNNTIIANSKTNTAKNPVTQIFYGKNVSKKCTFTGFLAVLVLLLAIIVLFFLKYDLNIDIDFLYNININ